MSLGGPEHFPAALWGGEAHRARSRELSALYVDRYTGPRTSAAFSSHSFWEFTFVFAGRGVFCAESDILLKPGVAVFVPPQLRHREISHEPMDTLWVGCAGSRLRDLDCRRTVRASAPELAPLCEQLWALAEQRHKKVGPEFDGLTCAIIAHLLRVSAEDSPSIPGAIDDLVKYIQRNYHRPLSVRELATRAGFSEGHFHRLFRVRVGASPNAFLESVRVRQAMRWIQHTSEPIKTIAARVGYPDAHYFSRAFKKATGFRPCDFRRTRQSAPYRFRHDVDVAT